MKPYRKETPLLSRAVFRNDDFLRELGYRATVAELSLSQNHKIENWIN